MRIKVFWKLDEWLARPEKRRYAWTPHFVNGELVWLEWLIKYPCTLWDRCGKHGGWAWKYEEARR